MCLQSTKCKISSSFPVYSAFLLLFLKISEQGNVNYQKVFLLIIFKLHFRVLVLCSKYQSEIILLFLRMQNLTFYLTSKYSKSESSSKLAGSLFSCQREKALPILFQIKKILFLNWIPRKSYQKCKSLQDIFDWFNTHQTFKRSSFRVAELRVINNFGFPGDLFEVSIMNAFPK